MQNTIYEIKYFLFLSWNWEAWCLTVWGVIPPPRKNTLWNKGRKYFHCLGTTNNLIRPWLRHLLTKVCILHPISLVTSHVSHPYKSTDFTQAFKILILISFRIIVDSNTFLSLENDPLAFWILTWTFVLAPPSSATTLPK